MSAWNGVYDEAYQDCDECASTTDLSMIFGMTLCGDCAADLFDPGPALPVVQGGE